ncbi:hypothetical protein HG536_0G02210 [Torulaspora globosa]|uniref:Uncharacterized protein n=1 Tax=Torulaspora globosa TaxID=48254 RepID=A0A7G3ZLH6_9SACH|nr:uncharacterized protein HG536_0G02210 [Torulaspora globosa]QLL34362.1 hypothetical protein HG536_0G02210 [Torulaspora globosa]
MADPSQASSSTSAFVSTLIFSGILGLIFLLVFVLLRPKKRRVYEPRTLTDLQTISEEQRVERVPDGWFSWVPYLLNQPHSYLMQHAGVDGYFFLRFVGMVASLSIVTCFILFPILLPVNATDGRDYSGFELLSFANVTNKNRFYAHVFLSWIFFGLVIYVIYRELYYYVVVRHAVQTSPLYDGLLSSRTVIMTELSDTFSHPGELERRFPEATKIFFALDHTQLQKYCKDRAETVARYEKTLNKILNKAVGMNLKAARKGKLDELYHNGSEAQDSLETYVPTNKRPTQRLGKVKLPYLSKKVDVIHYSQDHIAELNEKIHDEQRDWDQKATRPTVFMEFGTQLEAQRCFQSLESVMGKSAFGKRFIGVAPEDVNWDNVSFTKNKRRSKRAVANTLLTLMIIYWAIPVAVVGCISNVNFLANKVFFLHWINNIPSVILGLVTGVVPALALSILMSLVPPFIKKLGKMSGCMSVQEADLYCQSWYYAFLVIQVFLVVTATSSASATVEAIIKNPSSAMTLLANNLPKASNFYIAYFLIQGLTMPPFALAQIINLILSQLLGKILDKTPRQKWNRYNTLAKPDWGVVYPTVQILVCIWICYAIIAPLVLVFSSVTLGALYLADVYSYNFVQGFSADNRGRNYPRALFQIFVALYLAEICLLGLFIMAKAWGPLVLEVVIMVVTVLAHVYFKMKFIPLFDTVPLSAIRFARGEEGYGYPSDLGLKEIKIVAEDAKSSFESDETSGVLRPATSVELKRAHLLNTAEGNSNEGNEIPEESISEKPANAFDEHRRNSSESSSSAGIGNSSTAAVAPAKNKSTFAPDENFHKLSYKDLENRPREPREEYRNVHGALLDNTDVAKVYADPQAIVTDERSFPPNINKTMALKQRFINFFSPSKNYPFETVRMRLPHVFNTTIEYDEQFLEAAYSDPSVKEKDPIVWICRDHMGLSKQLIADARSKDVVVNDEFTKYDEKGKAMYLFNPPDFEYKAKR